MMMNRQNARVFIDTNILIFAENYQKENIFDWIDKLYGHVWIHSDVLAEVLQGKAKIEQEISTRKWAIFDPAELSIDENEIYEFYIEMIETAMQSMNDARARQGKRAKNTADTGEIATLAVCLLQDAQLICSDDADIAEVVARERYSYVDEQDQSKLIVQDTAADFCYYAVVEAGYSKSKVRHFYKTLFESRPLRARQLAAWDHRFDTLE
ncbi:PIN domain-containing protein [Lactiplantibacillus sp. WILCCON 0030]|uniref:PIN domain-containing protein n=2 Tax=Lactiplantibacillus brownii TaxID=3069269 RepID=A0ABU1A7N6_9LACO|nr:PIN domain-containing protein [Lactiplantibacillus brownii]MDQ7936953.1 PIN domain-containing protein [Lactiplantibacillus brownii]